MCPGTLALVAAGAAAAGSVVKGVGSADAASYQATVARNNATIARQNAGYSAAAGSAEVTQEGLKTRAAGANVRAGLAANGLDVSTGSPADVQVGQREIGGLDTATVASRAAEQVYGYQTQATSYDAQANLDSAQVPFDIAGGALGAVGSLAGNPSVQSGFSSLLSGAPSVPDNYAWMQSGSSATELGPGG